jgi:hypothetical protein
VLNNEKKYYILLIEMSAQIPGRVAALVTAENTTNSARRELDAAQAASRADPTNADLRDAAIAAEGAFAAAAAAEILSDMVLDTAENTAAQARIAAILARAPAGSPPELVASVNAELATAITQSAAQRVSRVLDVAATNPLERDVVEATFGEFSAAVNSAAAAAGNTGVIDALTIQLDAARAAGNAAEVTRLEGVISGQEDALTGNQGRRDQAIANGLINLADGLFNDGKRMKANCQDRADKAHADAEVAAAAVAEARRELAVLQAAVAARGPGGNGGAGAGNGGTGPRRARVNVNAEVATVNARIAAAEAAATAAAAEDARLAEINVRVQASTISTTIKVILGAVVILIAAIVAALVYINPFRVGAALTGSARIGAIVHEAYTRLSTSNIGGIMTRFVAADAQKTVVAFHLRGPSAALQILMPTLLEILGELIRMIITYCGGTTAIAGLGGALVKLSGIYASSGSVTGKQFMEILLTPLATAVGLPQSVVTMLRLGFATLGGALRSSRYKKRRSSQKRKRTLKRKIFGRFRI